MGYTSKIYFYFLKEQTLYRQKFLKMPPPFPKTAPAAVRLLGSFTLTLLRKNSNTFLLLSLTFFGGKKRDLGA